MPLTERIHQSPEPSETSILLKEAVFRFCEHVLLPSAIISMVGAFLFYLLDLRSLYYANTADLKRIGFCFTVATVLICRYGKVYEDSAKQRFYTGILGIATFFAMIRDSHQGPEIIVNLIIILLVWRFATSVTNSLHLEEISKPREEYRLYGVERLKMAEAMKKARQAQDSVKTEKKQKKDPFGNPARQVVRLALLAIICFAAGEPVILSAPAAISRQAFITVVIFLLSTGIVLAAGSAMGAYRQALNQEGKASLGMVPGKIFFAFTLLVIIVLIAFSLPIIHFQGSGAKQEIVRPGDGILSSQKETRQPGPARTKGDPSRTSPGQSQPQSWFKTLQGLGKLLLIAALIAGVIFGLYVLVRLRPNLRGMKKKLAGRWKTIWQKFKTLFSREKKPSPAGLTNEDPRKLLALIPTLPPHEALLASYRCLLSFFDRLGYKRNDRLTPHEYLYSLPPSLSALSEPARILTDLYIQAAFAPSNPQAANLSALAIQSLQQIAHFQKASSTVSKRT